MGSIFHAKVNIQALFAGTKTAYAMAFIYALRCSILAPALRKNTAVLKELSVDNHTTDEVKHATMKKPSAKRNISDASNDTYYVEISSPSPSNNHPHDTSLNRKKTGSDLYVLSWFGCGQILSAFSGSFACAPSTGAAITMYKLGGERYLISFHYFIPFNIKLTFLST